MSYTKPDFHRSFSEDHDRSYLSIDDIFEHTATVDESSKFDPKPEDKKDSKPEAKSKAKKVQPSLLLALSKAFGVDFFVRNLIRLFIVAMDMTGPILFGYVTF